MMSEHNTVAIFGPGLMGASLLMALRRMQPHSKLAVWARRDAALDELKSLNLADTYSTNAAAIAKDADTLILCLPIDHLESLSKDIASSVQSHALVTDVGSVKNSVVSCLEKIFSTHNNFIGSHPMCGSEASGLAAARADLYENALCIVSPTPQSQPKLVKRTLDFWNSIGARTFQMPPDTHDRAVALVSHVPHIAASALVEMVVRECPDSLPLCASGFRDTTRVASGSPDLWTSILSQNRKETLVALQSLIDVLKEFHSAIELDNTSHIHALLASAANERAKIFPSS